MRPPVIVGVDGSAAARAAACLGAWEAARRSCRLLLVHAHAVLPSLRDGELEPEPNRAVRRAALELLARSEAQVHAGHPLTRVRTVSIAGSAAGALVELSASAGLVVVGARGTGGFVGLRLGAVAAQVSRHALGPVIVVQPPVAGPAADEPCGPDPRPGRVVVGFDGSVESEAALGFAFDEATARQAPLTALFAWTSLPPDNHAWSPRLGEDLRRVRDERHRALAEAVARWAAKYPDVTVTSAVVPTMDPVSALVAASRDAGLVVVGHRGRGGFPTLLLGSVSHAVLAHAHCPVAVLRAGIDG